MVDNTLKQDQGLTFDVFRDDEEVPAEEAPPEEEEVEGQEKRAPKVPDEVFPKSVYVAEVVRNTRMYFFKVPKLGSYMAIRLEYDSCLFEGALD
jgi:hypothetical protein